MESLILIFFICLGLIFLFGVLTLWFMTIMYILDEKYINGFLLGLVSIMATCLVIMGIIKVFFK